MELPSNNKEPDSSSEKFNLIFSVGAFLVALIPYSNSISGLTIPLTIVDVEIGVIAASLIGLLAFSGYLQALSYFNSDYRVEITYLDNFYSICGYLSDFIYHLTLHLPLLIVLIIMLTKYTAQTIAVLLTLISSVITLLQAFENRKNEWEGKRESYRASILSAMWRQGAIESKYMPVENVLSKVPREQHHIAREVVQRLKEEKLIETHKNGKAISINIEKKDKVRDIVEGELPDFYFE